MISEIQKPSRRCKNIDISKLDVSLDLKRKFNSSKKKQLSDADIEGEDDNIYKEDDDDDDATNIFESTTAAKKLLKKKNPLGNRPATAVGTKAPSNLVGDELEKAIDELTITIDMNGKLKKKKDKKSDIVNELQEAKSSSKPPNRDRSAKPPSSVGAKSASQDPRSTKTPLVKTPKPLKLSKDKTSKPTKDNLKKGAGAMTAGSDLTGKIPGSADKPKVPLIKYTYAQLNLEPPSGVDYSTYNKDWCRYCGARYTSKFCNGPW